MAKVSKRVKKIWLAVGATAIGTLVLTAAIVWLESSRDTDLADSTESVTATSQQAGDLQAPPIRFTDVAAEWGAVMRHGPGPRHRTLTEDTGSGLAWGDIDSDGDWDLYLVNFPDESNPESEASNRLFRNDGNRFVDITAQAGVGDASGFGMGAWFVDYDEDGDQDLFVTNFGANRLFQNQDDGTFIDVAGTAGVAGSSWSTGVAWGDFNRDGHVDLYVCNYVEFYAPDISQGDAFADASGETYSVPFTLNPNSFDPQVNCLYINRGDGTFQDMAVIYGVDDPEGRSLSATSCDFDGDGWLDLYVNNDVSTNRLYRNAGRGREVINEVVAVSGTVPIPGSDPIPFEDHSTLSGTADPRGSMGLSVGEFGFMTGAADHSPDLFITHWIAQENALYQSTMISPGVLLYLDKTRQVRLGEVSIGAVGWGCTVADFDFDGLSDIVVANGSTLEQTADLRSLQSERPFLFWNGSRRFLDVAKAAGDAMSSTHNARGLAAADFDNDGDVDLAISINRGQLLLLKNETVTEHASLSVRLRGSAAVCFGARVELVAAKKSQYRWYGADASFLSMHATDLLFGLGDAAKADRLIVTWADGRVSTLENVDPGRIEVDHNNATDPAR